MSNTPPLDFLISETYNHAREILKFGNELPGNIISFFTQNTAMKMMTASENEFSKITGQPDSFQVLQKIAIGMNAQAFSIAIPTEITDSVNRKKEAILIYASKRDSRNKIQSEACVFYIERGNLQRITNITKPEKFNKTLPKGIKEILSQNPPKKSEMIKASNYLKEELNMDLSKINQFEGNEEPQFSRNIEDIENLPDWIK